MGIKITLLKIWQAKIIEYGLYASGVLYPKINSLFVKVFLNSVTLSKFTVTFPFQVAAGHW